MENVTDNPAYKTLNTVSNVTELSTNKVLASLLSTENITIKVSDKMGAAFDCTNRVLYLPQMKYLLPDIRVVQIAHECGHALYSPRDYENQVEGKNHALINVLEDARIERMIKREYPGLRKMFAIGRRLMWDEMTANSDGVGNSTDLIDRYLRDFKFNIPQQYTVEEQKWVDRFNSTVTFVDVLRLAEEYENDKPDNDNQPMPEFNLDSIDGSDNGEQAESGESYPEYEPAPVEISVQEAEQKYLDKKIEAGLYSVNHSDKDPIVLGEGSTLTGTVVMSRDDLLKRIASFMMSENTKPCIRDAAEYVESIKPLVQQMVLTFEQKKSAQVYRNTQQQSTGKLNLQRLPMYRVSDDIFLQRAKVAEGKNHEVVFVIDLSGSMRKIWQPAIKQLIQMITFFRQAGIKYKVLGFTTVKNDIDLGVFELFNDSDSRAQFYELAGVLLSNVIASMCGVNVAQTPTARMMAWVYKNYGALFSNNTKHILYLLTDGVANDAPFENGRIFVEAKSKQTLSTNNMVHGALTAIKMRYDPQIIQFGIVADNMMKKTNRSFADMRQQLFMPYNLFDTLKETGYMQQKNNVFLSVAVRADMFESMEEIDVSDLAGAKGVKSISKKFSKLVLRNKALSPILTTVVANLS